jgi:hypothetical protein
MATTDTSLTTEKPHKVDWLAEIRGLALMLLAVLGVFDSPRGKAVLHPLDLDDADPVGG